MQSIQKLEQPLKTNRNPRLNLSIGLQMPLSKVSKYSSMRKYLERVICKTIIEVVAHRKQNHSFKEVLGIEY